MPPVFLPLSLRSPFVISCSLKIRLGLWTMERHIFKFSHINFKNVYLSLLLCFWDTVTVSWGSTNSHMKIFRLKSEVEWIRYSFFSSFPSFSVKGTWSNLRAPTILLIFYFFFQVMLILWQFFVQFSIHYNLITCITNIILYWIITIFSCLCNDFTNTFVRSKRN